jgi:CDP-glucose 4,6-dehydratase
MENMVKSSSTLFDTYQGKKVFLTGHTGFKGSWMLAMLNQLGATVKGYALPPKTPHDLYHLIDGDKLCDSVIADLRDFNRLETEIANFQPDFIFHFAAQPLVRESYKDPRETYEINVIGTINVLEALKKVTQKCSVVMVTTDKVYFNHEWSFAYRENDELGGKDPYSASKACSELVIQSYQHTIFPLSDLNQHQKGISVARAGNIIGGGDWSEDRLVPDFIRSVYVDSSIKIRSPRAVRPWQHVLDPLNGYLTLGQALNNDPFSFSTPFNFGPKIQDCVNVESVINQCISYWKKGTLEIVNEDKAMKESHFLMLDTSKVERELEWTPKLNLQQGLKKTIDWYATFQNNPKQIKAYTFEQIKTFLG